ncbi:MAG: MATE family efflux transporter [Oscillospiraceae bacterium]
MQGEGLKKLQSGQPISTRELLLLIAQLSWPAILAQISSVVMQYIDTAMVGQLGSNASAAIGVVATTSWLFGDLCIALTIGFNVAVAQALGARQSEKARGIMKLAFLVCMAFSLVMMAIALGITGNLPRWLRADPAIWQDASAYFLVYVLSLPFMQMNNLCGGLLRSAGNMKTPGICMVVMCLLDVVFNAFLIFPSGTLRVLGVTLPGFGLGVLGASMGTALSQVVIAVVLVYILLVRSPELYPWRGEKARFTAAQLKRCLSISAPVMGERTILSTARMVTTAIGPAGHHRHGGQLFAITAESLCYMSALRAGGGLHAGGPERSAGRKDLTHRLGWLTVALGMGLMGSRGRCCMCWPRP